MKITVATNNSNLSILRRLDEPLIVYTANPDIYREVSQIRDKISHMTIVILDKHKKNINQVILEYSKSLEEQGVTELEPFILKDSGVYVTPIFIVLVLIVVFLIIGLAFYRTCNKNNE